MRSLSELGVKGPSSAIAHFLERLDGVLTGGWRRDRDIEGRLQQMGIRAGTARCYARPADGDRPAVALWLVSQGPAELRVSSVVPLGGRSLTDDDYNAVLADFKSTVLQPAGRGGGVEVELGPRPVALDAYLSPEAVRRLTAFSEEANRSRLHSSDVRRWHAFVAQAHLERSGLGRELLEIWLADQGWPEVRCRQLAEEYENALSALSAYDEERADKCLQ